METKLCKCCGRELPIEMFNKHKRNSDGLQIYCKDCQKQKNQLSINKRKLEVINSELAKYTPRELINELRRRGYKGTLTYEQQIKL